MKKTQRKPKVKKPTRAVMEKLRKVVARLGGKEEAKKVLEILYQS